MQNVIRDLGQFPFFLVDPVLRTLLRSSAPLRFAQDDTTGLCSHKPVGVGAHDDPIFNQILFFFGRGDPSPTVRSPFSL